MYNYVHGRESSIVGEGDRQGWGGGIGIKYTERNIVIQWSVHSLASSSESSRFFFFLLYLSLDRDLDLDLLSSSEWERLRLCFLFFFPETVKKSIVVSSNFKCPGSLLHSSPTPSLLSLSPLPLSPSSSDILSCCRLFLCSSSLELVGVEVEEMEILSTSSSLSSLEVLLTSRWTSLVGSTRMKLRHS